MIADGRQRMENASSLRGRCSRYGPAEGCTEEGPVVDVDVEVDVDEAMLGEVVVVVRGLGHNVEERSCLGIRVRMLTGTRTRTTAPC